MTLLVFPGIQRKPCCRSILYQRGIYPPESFRRVPKYGLTMLVTTDEGLINYLKSVLAQLDGKAEFFA